jgi:RTX calcium-binding nonapeptide repeat (4 copies)
MTAPTGYTTGLSAQILSELFGYLQRQEGFGETVRPRITPGYVYMDSQGHATVGYGFLLDGTPPNSLGAVLDAMTYSGTVTLQNGQQITYSNENVFQAAAKAATAQGLAVPSVNTIVSYFSTLVQDFQTQNNPPQALQSYLDQALQDYFEGHFPIIHQIPPVPRQAQFLHFALTETQAAGALLNLVEGATVSEGVAGSLTISGKSSELYDILVKFGVPTDANGNLAGLSPNSPQWEALLAVFYNGGLAGASQALRYGNMAQAWYDLRYRINNPMIRGQDALGFAVRDYLQSQMFGLNGGLPNSYSQAIQAYEMLDEHRQAILQYEQRFGADPDSTRSPMSAPASTAIPRAAATAALIGLPKYQYSSGTQTFFPAGSPVVVTPTVPGALADPNLAVDLTLAAELNPEAEQIAAAINGWYSQIVPSVGVLNDSAMSGGSFLVRSTDILVAPDATEVSQNFASNVFGEFVGATDSPNATHILLGPDSVASSGPSSNLGLAQVVLMGGNGSDLLIAGAGDEWLNAGPSGNDTLIGGQGLPSSVCAAAGNDTCYGGDGNDTFDFALASSGSISETIMPALLTRGIVEVSYQGAVTILGGSQAAPLKKETTSTDPNKIVWSQDGSSSGFQYTFDKIADTIAMTLIPRISRMERSISRSSWIRQPRNP